MRTSQLSWAIVLAACVPEVDPLPAETDVDTEPDTDVDTDVDTDADTDTEPRNPCLERWVDGVTHVESARESRLAFDGEDLVWVIPEAEEVSVRTVSCAGDVLHGPVRTAGAGDVSLLSLVADRGRFAATGIQGSYTRSVRLWGDPGDLGSVVSHDVASYGFIEGDLENVIGENAYLYDTPVGWFSVRALARLGEDSLVVSEAGPDGSAGRTLVTFRPAEGVSVRARSLAWDGRDLALRWFEGGGATVSPSGSVTMRPYDARVSQGIAADDDGLMFSWHRQGDTLLLDGPNGTTRSVRATEREPLDVAAFDGRLFVLHPVDGDVALTVLDSSLQVEYERSGLVEGRPRRVVPVDRDHVALLHTTVERFDDGTTSGFRTLETVRLYTVP